MGRPNVPQPICLLKRTVDQKVPVSPHKVVANPYGSKHRQEERSMISRLVVVFTLFCSTPTLVLAMDAPISGGRYTLVQPGPTAPQIDLLQTIVNHRFTENVRSVGQALDAVLEPSGYSLAALHSSDPKLPVLLSARLPQVQRKLGPMTLEQALNILAGPAWNLVVDPVHRKVSFELGRGGCGSAAASLGDRPRVSAGVAGVAG